MTDYEPKGSVETIQAIPDYQEGYWASGGRDVTLRDSGERCMPGWVSNLYAPSLRFLYAAALDSASSAFMNWFESETQPNVS